MIKETSERPGSGSIRVKRDTCSATGLISAGPVLSLPGRLKVDMCRLNALVANQRAKRQIHPRLEQCMAVVCESQCGDKSIETTHVYLEADLATKERALQN